MSYGKDYSDWLAGLSVGDDVALDAGFSGYSIAKVEKLTATQIVIGNSRYKRDSGRLIGASGYRVSFLKMPTDEVIASVLAEQISTLVRNGKHKSLPIEVLRQLKRTIQSSRATNDQ